MGEAAGSQGSGREGDGSFRGALVLLAGGSGSRLGAATNKVLLPLAGRPVLAWSLEWTRGLPWLARTVVVVRAEDEPVVRDLLATQTGRGGAVDVVVGGPSRHGSEWNAIRHLGDEIRSGGLDVVVVHDAARPLAGTRLFDAVAATAHRVGGAVPVVTRTGLVALERAGDDRAAEDQGGDEDQDQDQGVGPGTEPGGALAAVQTPQGFRARELLAAFEAAERAGFEGTDTAACLERFSPVDVRAEPGSETNIKVTFPEDLAVAAGVLSQNGGRMP